MFGKVAITSEEAIDYLVPDLGDVGSGSEERKVSILQRGGWHRRSLRAVALIVDQVGGTSLATAAVTVPFFPDAVVTFVPFFHFGPRACSSRFLASICSWMIGAAKLRPNKGLLLRQYPASTIPRDSVTH